MAVAVRAVLVTRRTHVMELERHRIALPGAAEARRAVMAFETHGEHNRPAQQARVRGTVRVVADLAAFDADRGMFEHEWPALFFVTFEAGFLVAEGLLHHARPLAVSPGRRVRAVGVVAVGADHDAFVDAVLERHRELGADIGVAAIAHLHLRVG